MQINGLFTRERPVSDEEGSLLNWSLLLLIWDSKQRFCTIGQPKRDRIALLSQEKTLWCKRAFAAAITRIESVDLGQFFFTCLEELLLKFGIVPLNCVFICD